MSAVSIYRTAGFLAIAAVVLLVGWKSLHSEDVRGRGTSAGGSAADPSGRTEQKGGPAGGLEIEAGSRRIVVDVSGAVRRPGVYRFEHGRRVIDAIRRAGGPTRRSFASGINRAALLSDGQQVVVPSHASGPDQAGGGSAAGPAGAAVADAPMSLGTATQEQLEQIEGIGPVTAQGILEFRDSQGGVSSIDELDEVSGIGPVTMEALRSRLQP